MVLITDGGSTKCDWMLLDNTGAVLLKTQTKGLNPTVLSAREIENRICDNEQLLKVFNTVVQLDFYGAGCGTQTPRLQLAKVLERLFANATVTVQEDLAAAVYAVTTAPSIVCILGTGSNSCYFDGSTIHAPIPALGYSLMDEASGNYFGKQLLRDYFYGKMPKTLAENFSQHFNVDPDEIKLKLYQEPNPNAYLAGFAQFLFQQERSAKYIEDLLTNGLNEFINARILTFPECNTVPIHFIGSIAHYSAPIIEKCLETHQLSLGTILQRPMDGLVAFYKEKLART